MTCGNGIEVPVALAPGRPGAYTISGELCSTAAERHRGAMVQLLIPGATYSHGYWDFGSMSGVTYSYARAVAAEGIATFTIDRTVRRRMARPQAAGKRQRRSTFSVRQGVAARSVPPGGGTASTGQFASRMT